MIDDTGCSINQNAPFAIRINTISIVRPTMQLPSLTDLTLMSPSGFKLVLLDVPRLSHTHDEHTGPRAALPAPSIFRRSLVRGRNLEPLKE